tara:strand:- start:31464 stop:31583 length:120 start_codon:yes stop_codon:yes gene_type:complete
LLVYVKNYNKVPGWVKKRLKTKEPEGGIGWGNFRDGRSA